MLKLHPTPSLSNLEDNMVPIEGGVMKIQGVNIQLDDFELCRYLVSQQLWYEVMGQNPEELYFKNPHRPVEGISWNDTQDKFLPALREQTRESSWRLPTEAQWEYAARGGKYAKPYTYAGSEHLKEVGWYEDRNKSEINSYRETNPLGCQRPNALGLYDMSGNVFEWCQDLYDSSYYQTLKDQYADQPVPNPGGPEEGDFRVVRGGSWFGSPSDARVSIRFFSSPNYRFFDVGFRLCRYSAR